MAKKKAKRPAVRGKRELTVTRKPDGFGHDGGGNKVKREHLAEITEDGVHVDSAYFATEDAALEWARAVYKMPV